MSMSDPVADMLTRIRNAQARAKAKVSMPSSKLKLAIAKVLHEEGYINGCEEATNSANHKELTIELKYYQGKPAISSIRRASRPGLRFYRRVANIPQVMGGMGTVIFSTPKGVMSGKKAKAVNCGGEILCVVE
ncbi:MAG: 30S ribosomal protein S8 [Gammaproteobacteria bacterium]|nr:30S ribosomal protein S8 [Gammaproteobacteria bacterium]